MSSSSHVVYHDSVDVCTVVDALYGVCAPGFSCFSYLLL